MRIVYSLLYLLALVLVFPFELMKRPSGGRGAWLREKLGLCTKRTGAEPLLWVHAVSVGEAMAASTFIRAFIARHPEYRTVVSTITDTGQAVARQRLAGVAEAIYLPFDLTCMMRAAIKRLRPDAFVVMETELWPNMIHAMNLGGVPVLLLNGRLSEKSFRGYMRIRFALGGMLGGVEAFGMQDDTYARRITELGAPEARVRSTGNFKFDFSARGDVLEWTKGLRGPVIVVGSTHRGEDEVFISAYAELRGALPELNMVLAPRHPERFDEVAELLGSKGLSFIRRSAIKAGQGITGKAILLDTVGELSAVYSAADVAVVGGSFIPHGGQNPLEPAYFGKPVVCGPHMHNFPFIDEFYARGAALRATSDELAGALTRLLQNPDEREAMGQRARELLLDNRGAVQRALDLLDSVIGAAA